MRPSVKCFVGTAVMRPSVTCFVGTAVMRPSVKCFVDAAVKHCGVFNDFLEAVLSPLLSVVSSVDEEQKSMDQVYVCFVCAFVLCVFVCFLFVCCCFFGGLLVVFFWFFLNTKRYYNGFEI